MPRGCKPGERRGGRKKGIPNKVSTTAKENFIKVFDKLGGEGKMAQWAEDNQTEFYRLYARILPTDVNLGGQEDNPVSIISATPISAEAWQKKHGDEK